VGFCWLRFFAVESLAADRLLPVLEAEVTRDWDGWIDIGGRPDGIKLTD